MCLICQPTYHGNSIFEPALPSNFASPGLTPLSATLQPVFEALKPPIPQLLLLGTISPPPSEWGGDWIILRVGVLSDLLANMELFQPLGYKHVL